MHKINSHWLQTTHRFIQIYHKHSRKILHSYKWDKGKTKVAGGFFSKCGNRRVENGRVSFEKALNFTRMNGPPITMFTIYIYSIDTHLQDQFNIPHTCPQTWQFDHRSLSATRTTLLAHYLLKTCTIFYDIVSWNQNNGRKTHTQIDVDR